MINHTHAAICKALFDGLLPFTYITGSHGLEKYLLEAEKLGLVKDDELTENGRLLAQQCISIAPGPISYIHDRDKYELAIGKYLTLIGR